MSKNFTRREFLRTTGAAVLAVAAAGALSACGGSGGSYIPNPNPSTAKTLGDLAFDVTGVSFSASGSGTNYTHIYTPVLSIKNSCTSEIPLTNITFAMCLTTPNSNDNATYVGVYTDENCQTMLSTLSASKTTPAYVKFTYNSTEISPKIAYLTITYDGKKVTYKLDGQVFSASGVTNA